MTNDVVLSAALRTNLLSLQGTQSNIDQVQKALSTGLKVNSALDNPQSFFAAKSLNNRAGDLNRLLDGIGQSISTIQAADKGITSLTKLVEQADSIAQQAADTINNSNTEAKLTGTVDLTQYDQLTDLSTISNGDNFTITTTDSTDSTSSVNETITINTGDSVQRIAAEITDQFANSQNGEVTASVDSKGQLQIKSANGDAFHIVINQLGGAATSAPITAGLQSLGLSDFFGTENTGVGAATTQVSTTITASDSLTSVALYKSATELADGSTTLTSLLNESGTSIAGGLDNAADLARITINDGTQVTFALNGTTVQGLVDGINNNTTINDFVEASYDADTGQFAIKAISADTKTVEFGVVGNDNTTQLDFGFGGQALDIGATHNAEDRVYALGTAAGELASLESDYNTVLTQLDQLVGDSDYRGTNLLNGDTSTTYFNEDRSSSLSVEGANFTTAGLGLSTADFSRSVSVTQSISELRTATDSIRSYGSTLANNLAVIQTREEFTSNLVDELEAGADKLTVADANEEGAKLLALQTRQQLGVTALSLASQSQQSVLRLF